VRQVREPLGHWLALDDYGWFREYGKGRGLVFFIRIEIDFQMQLILHQFQDNPTEKADYK
jgi:hypothetical protein